MTNILELKNISKTFPGVRALDNVSVEFEAGTIHAIVGENGAGKSTLMKVIYGVYKMDSGEIFYENKPVKIDKPSKAIDLGISIIYQETSLFNNLSIAANIVVGNEPRRRSLLNWRESRKMATKILKELDFEVPVDEVVSNLSVTQQQLVEIGRAISRRCRILIMDEPTATLTEKEVEKLFKIMRKLADNGSTVVFISHRISEVMEISDAITVMKDGKVVGTEETKKIKLADIVKMMIGIELKDYFPPKTKQDDKEVILQVKNLGRDDKVFNNISFDLFKGEILGIVALEGQGQHEIARAIFGLESYDFGEIIINGKSIKPTPSRAIGSGIVYISDDRKKEGLLLQRDLRENITLSTLDERKTFGFIKFKEERNKIKTAIDMLNIKALSISQVVFFLSGGNQQKTLIARSFITSPFIMIADEPTKGIDVGSKVEIYNFLRDCANKSMGILLLSRDLMELLGLCDRLLVVYKGTIVNEFSGDEATEEKCMAAAIGTLKG